MTRLDRAADLILYKILPVVLLVMVVAAMLGFVGLAAYGALCAVHGCAEVQP